MKKTGIILLILVMSALAIFIFWDPILDLLPIDQSGWVERDGMRYLLDEDGDPLTGWHTIDGSRVYFHEDGTLQTGWLEKDGKRYCFDSEGFLRTGLLEQDGKRYFLDENGCPVSGWQQLGDHQCYITESGTIVTGWLSYEKQTFYLDDQGCRYTGWLDEDGSRYYLDEQGVLATGWLTQEGNTYYIGTNGMMAVGWTDIEGNTYFFDDAGCLCTGWLDREGQRYYFDDSGILYTGWLEKDGNRYYLQEDGTLAVGKITIDGQNYFFSSTGINFILVNPWNPLPEGFEVELVQVPGAWVDPVCQDDLAQMLADCRADGHSPQIVSSYRSIADQRINLQNMVNSMGGDYAAATKIVAVPGTSEHHLGLALDIVDSGYPKLDHQQADMPAQKWLMEHCWEYGFILRYPENTTEITGIIWEPWHYRYVGTEISLEIRDLGGITLEEYIDMLTNDGTTCGGKTTADE